MFDPIICVENLSVKQIFRTFQFLKTLSNKPENAVLLSQFS